jgi:hypothetical protein
LVELFSEDIQKKVTTSFPNLKDFIESDCDKCSKNCEVPSFEIFCCMIKKVAEKSNFVTKPEHAEKVSMNTLIKSDDRIIKHKEKPKRKECKKNKQYVSQGKCWFPFETGDETDD